MDNATIERLEAEGWTVYEDGDGCFTWASADDEIVAVDVLDVWGHVGWGKGNRAKDKAYILIAGPFDTIEAAQATYLLIVDNRNQKE